MKFSIKDFFSKFNEIHRKMLTLSLIENFIFVCSDLNNLSVLTYFRCHLYFIYCVDDVSFLENQKYINK